MQRVDGGLGYLWTEDTQLILGKLVIEFKRARAVRLVLSGITLADVRLVDRMVQLVLHSVFGGELQQGLVELALTHPLIVHVHADTVLTLAFAAEVGHLPNPAITF